MLSRADKVMRRSGRVSAVHTRELLDRLSFDRSDLVFVGVAAEGPDRIIVSEDSDYSSEVRSYLLSEMGVAVVSVEDAIALARVP